jgi:hypothetical protein
MFIALQHLEICAPEERNVHADHMSLLAERRNMVRLRAINMLLLRSKDRSAKYVITSRRDGMPKDRTKNVDRYKIRGGVINEYEYHENQEATKLSEPQKGTKSTKTKKASKNATTGASAKKLAARKAAKK